MAPPPLLPHPFLPTKNFRHSSPPLFLLPPSLLHHLLSILPLHPSLLTPLVFFLSLPLLLRAKEEGSTLVNLKSLMKGIKRKRKMSISTQNKTKINKTKTILNNKINNKIKKIKHKQQKINNSHNNNSHNKTLSALSTPQQV